MEENMSTLFSHIKEIEQSITTIDTNLSFPIQFDFAHYNDIRCLLSRYKAKLISSEEQIVVLNCKIEGLKNEIAIKEQQWTRNMEDKIKAQKKEFEAIMEKQLSFIDTIVKDKQDLIDKCTLLKQERAKLNKANEKAIKELEEKHKKELKNSKEAWRAAEKLSREKWEAEATLRIKQLTIKGMEPEILKREAAYKQQINSIIKKHGEEIEGIKAQLTHEYDERLTKLKMELTSINHI